MKITFFSVATRDERFGDLIIFSVGSVKMKVASVPVILHAIFESNLSEERFILATNIKYAKL